MISGKMLRGSGGREDFAKAMPRAEYAIEDVPLSDPIFHTMFKVKKVSRVTNIRSGRARRREEHIRIPHQHLIELLNL
jgi:hypothetical protein